MATPQNRIPKVRQTESFDRGENRESSRASREGNGREQLRRVYGQAEDCVRENLTSAAVVTFGAGVLLGTALVWVLGPSRRRQVWREPAHVSWNSLRDAVSQHLPDALARYVKSECS